MKRNEVQQGTVSKRIPFETGYLSLPLEPLENVHLLGTKCGDCKAIVFGSWLRCENCSSSNVEVIKLGKKGKIWSYSFVHYPPPPPFKPDNPFVALPVAWVELPEGLRILSYLDCVPKNLKIGMDVKLVLEDAWVDENGNQAVMYKFKQV